MKLLIVKNVRRKTKNKASKKERKKRAATFLKKDVAAFCERDILICVMKTITYKNDTYQIPFKITCTVSSVTKTYTSEEYINGKLDRFGGLENLIKTYVCRDAKRALKGKTEKKKDEVKPKNIFAEMIKNQPLMLTYPISKPVAKKDKKGNYRDAKGRIIAKANIDRYDLIAA